MTIYDFGTVLIYAGFMFLAIGICLFVAGQFFDD